MKVRPVVPSAEHFPEVPNARIVVQREGGFLPRGHWRVLSRVISPGWWKRPPETPTGLAAQEDGYPLDILLVAPLFSQAWWERHREWRWGGGFDRARQG